MSTTFKFEEFDDATREYLLEVREREGRGTPGVFAPVNASLAGCGCIMGPIIIITTLCGTLFSGLIYKDPTRLAMLQTAGLLLGGWMLIAAFRVWGSKNSPKRAGTWVYGDPLFLYEAQGEDVKVTPVDEVIEAQFTHNYNNGAYQNSVVKLLMPGNSIVSAQVHNEQRAEQMVVYYNYLAWARGSEGGQRGELPPASLGGLAKYVAKNDNEPLDGEGNVNLDLIELDIAEVPEEPRAENKGMPNFLPYIVILVSAAACFFVMKSINVPFRDDEIYKAVTSPPVEPALLRQYLLDTRNKKHRDEVLQRLANMYETPINHARGAKDANLRAGMIAVLDELKKAEIPVASIRVKELAPPTAGQGGGADREKDLRTKFADKLRAEYGRIMPAPVAPPGMVFTTPPQPIGYQMIELVEAPEEAAAHFEVSYKFEPDAATAMVKVTYTVTIRTRIEDGATAAGPKTFALTDKYAATSVNSALEAIANELMKDMVGTGAPIQGGVPPGGFQPNNPFQ